MALSILSLLLLPLLVACGGAGNPDFESPGSARTDPYTTLVLAYDGWTGTYLSSYVLKVIFEDELGYQSRVAKQANIPAAFESLSSGRTDIFISAWFPARDSTLDKHPDLLRLGVVYGGETKDAFEGWMVSGDLAREYRLTHVRDLNDRQLALALDSDGNGRGNLIGCPSSWVCAGQHPQILQDFGLAGLYDVDIPADEKELVSLVEGRLRDGKTALFYWYQPSFFPGDLPITDLAVWLEGTSPYLPLAFNRTVVRSDFVANYPDAAKVLSEFEISGQDIGWSIGRIQDKGESDKFLEELARTWITEHRAEVDRWLTGVRGRTPTKSLPSETLTLAYSPEKEDLFLNLVIDFNLSLPPDIPPIRPVRVSMGKC